MKENLQEGFSLFKVEIYEMINFTGKNITKIQHGTIYLLFDIYFDIFLINEIISVYEIYKDGNNFNIYTSCTLFPFLCGILCKIFRPNSTTSLLIFILINSKNGF